MHGCPLKCSIPQLTRDRPHLAIYIHSDVSFLKYTHDLIIFVVFLLTSVLVHRSSILARDPGTNGISAKYLVSFSKGRDLHDQCSGVSPVWRAAYGALSRSVGRTYLPNARLLMWSFKSSKKRFKLIGSSNPIS